VAENAEYPLLALPEGTRFAHPPPRIYGGGAPNPGKTRQIQRLDPQFRELQRVLDAHAALISETAAATAPEHVLVLVTNGASKAFVETLASLPDLEWLLGHDERVPPDDDFRHRKEKDRDKELSATFYMVLFNQKAVEQLLSAWHAYSTSKRVPRAFRSWGKVFECLREIRRWGPEDRLREAHLLEDWLNPIDPRRFIPVEIELWARGGKRGQAAERDVGTLVGQAGGRVLDVATIPEIAYHALLAELPLEEVRALLHDPNVALVQADDIFQIRAVPQSSTEIAAEGTTEGPPVTGALPGRAPICALLDGLPMENHRHLAERIVVDDPEGWAATYPVADRRHGTAMASLILHGDLHTKNVPLPTLLHVQPILRPEGQRETAPRDHLWVDLIHRAVRRMLAGDGETPATAPGVRVINLSVGDVGRPFLHELSPLARLLDWLAWRYQVLFVVSAGNHRSEIPDDVCASDEHVIRHLFRDTRQRRILCPGEAINSLTVGSLNHDGDGPAPAGARTVLPRRPDLPAAYSAQGRGFRRCVKPDILVPGGRQLFEQMPPTAGSPWRALGAQRDLGQLVATPGASGRSPTTKIIGTSNAAALTSRSAAFIHEAVAELQAQTLPDVPIALLLKALLVHTADWPRDVEDLCASALTSDVDRNRLKDHLSGVLGYGALRPERSLGCTPNRATAVGGGVIECNERIVHTLPVPQCLQARTDWRRVTLTLAWFTPIRPTDRRYRVARLRLIPPREREPLMVEGGQVHGDASIRGTLQHVILEAKKSAMLVADNAVIEFAVTCMGDAGELDAAIPYAVAVSLETAPEVELPIYQQVAERLRVRTVVRS
jgi:hypothetical protein